MRFAISWMLVAVLSCVAQTAQAAASAVPVNASAAATYSTSTLDGGKFGKLTIYRPTGDIQSVVLFVSGDGGWHLGVVDAAQRFAAEGALVVGIDVRQYLAAIKPRDPAASAQRCVSLAGDFENLSHYVQRALDLSEYQLPSLVGYSSGATIVYAALAQAPHGTFRSAISLGFCPDQTFNGARPCKVYGLEYAEDTRPKAADNLVFEPHKTLRDPWIAVQGARDQVCDADTTRAFSARVPSAQLLDLPRVGHGFSVTSNWWPQLRETYRGLPVSVHGGAATVSGIGELPLHEVPASGPRGDQMALLITGDGGWAGLDQDLAAELAAGGVSVVALSSIKYFWKAHTPEQTANDVVALLRHYMQKWAASKVLLLGYSFGADVLPFVMNRLPAELRDSVSVMALLGPSREANFEIAVAGWIPGVTIKGLAVIPEVQRLDAKLPILCIHGAEEPDSICTLLQSPQIRVQAIGSGHHFGGDVKAIAAALSAYH